MGLKELNDAQDIWNNLNTNVAKNIILFIGDGMSLPTQTATRIFKAQNQDSQVKGEETFLSFEKFPHMGLSKVYQYYSIK